MQITKIMHVANRENQDRTFKKYCRAKCIYLHALYNF